LGFSSWPLFFSDPSVVIVTLTNAIAIVVPLQCDYVIADSKFCPWGITNKRKAEYLIITIKRY
jgi:hypothetical protein